MRLSKELKKREREMPPQYSQRFTYEWFRRFTFKERLAILFGRRNFVMTCLFYTVQKPGRCQPVFEASLTPAQTPVEQQMLTQQQEMAEVMRDAMAPTENQTPPTA